MRRFDYYIYIDYSENLIGYTIIEGDKINEILPRISKLHHYKKVKHKRAYISVMKKKFKKEHIVNLLLKWKIKKVRSNLNVFLDVVEFVKKNDNCAVFLSVDNNQYISFMKLLKLIPYQEHATVVRESELKKGSVEYKLSLIIDTMLNLERKVKSK